MLLVFVLVLLTTRPAVGASTEVVRSGPRASGAVALTFDDGWGIDACAQITKTLRKSGAKATFFINGNYLKLDPKRWRKILRGMPLGNHTRSHRNLVTESGLVARKQLKQNEDLHERLLGRPMLKVFRPPYGAYDAKVLGIAADLGYRHVVLWNISAADTSSSATVETIIRRTTGARPGSIILMHCARDITAQALPRIVAHYQRRGIELVGLDELLGMTSESDSPGKNKADKNKADKTKADKTRAESDAEPAAQPVPLMEALGRLLSKGLAAALAIIEGNAAYE